MPALPSAGFLIKLLLNYAAPAVPYIVNRLFFQGTANPSPSNLNTASQAIANAWATNIAPNVATPLNLVVVNMEDLSSSLAANGIWTGAKPGGAGAAAITSPTTAFVIKNVTQDRYRGGHSRIYLPGIPLTNLSTDDGNTWNTTFASTLVTAWQAFLNAVITACQNNGCGTGSMAVPHFYKNHTWNHFGTAPHDWYKYVATPQVAPIPVDTYLPAAVSYNPTIGTQRRRSHQSV